MQRIVFLLQYCFKYIDAQKFPKEGEYPFGMFKFLQEGHKLHQNQPLRWKRQKKKNMSSWHPTNHLLTSRAVDILFFDLLRGQTNMSIAWEVKRSKKEVKTINCKNAPIALCREKLNCPSKFELPFP